MAPFAVFAQLQGAPPAAVGTWLAILIGFLGAAYVVLGIAKHWRDLRQPVRSPVEDRPVTLKQLDREVTDLRERILDVKKAAEAAENYAKQQAQTLAGSLQVLQSKVDLMPHQFREDVRTLVQSAVGKIEESQHQMREEIVALKVAVESRLASQEDRP